MEADISKGYAPGFSVYVSYGRFYIPPLSAVDLVPCYL